MAEEKNKEIVVDQDFIDSMEPLRQPDKSKGLIANCKDSVVLFSEYMLGIRLYAWQVHFLNRIQKEMEDPNSTKEFIALTSRQVGKSTALAIFSLWSTAFNKYPGTVSNNTLVGIASASDVQAKKLLYEMKKLIRLGDRYMEQNYKNAEGEPIYKDLFSSLIDEHEANNTTTISFKAWEDKHGEFLKGSKSGSVIKSYPPTSAILGETFSIVIIDEAGKTDKITDQFFYDYMYPTGNSTNALRVYTSTPWENSGFFYRLVDPDNMYPENDTDVFVFTVDSIKLENPQYYNIVMKIVKDLQSSGKNDEVQRAYYCRFVKGEQSYFDPEKVFESFDGDNSKLEQFSKSCDMGIDFGGQVKSKSVITISYLDENTNEVHRIYHKTYPVGEDLTLVEDVKELMTRFNIERIIPDDCPAGYFFIRQMQEKGFNVHPMSFRSEKVKKYGGFRSKMNKGLIKSYKDEDLQTEMLAMEFSQSSKQSIIQHAPGYSDDLIDSFVMSAYFFLDEDDSVQFFDYAPNDVQYSNGCQQCGGSKIVNNECKTCGWIQR